MSQVKNKQSDPALSFWKWHRVLVISISAESGTLQTCSLKEEILDLHSQWLSEVLCISKCIHILCQLEAILRDCYCLSWLLWGSKAYICVSLRLNGLTSALAQQVATSWDIWAKNSDSETNPLRIPSDGWHRVPCSRKRKVLPFKVGFGIAPIRAQSCE